MAVARQTYLDVWSQALRRLSSEPLPPLLVIAGESPFPKERLISAAETETHGEHEAFSQLPGEKDRPALQRLLDRWGTATLFGTGQLIVARDIGHLLKGNGAKLIETRLTDATPPNRLLITLASLDGRSRLAKQLKKLGGMVNLPVLRDAPPPWHTGGPFLETDLNAWITAEAREQGLQVDLTAADELSRRIGNEPGRIAQRLTQLSALLGDGECLTAEFVATHVAHSSVRLLGLYEEALRDGRVGEALQLVDRMVNGGVHDPFQRLVSGPAVAETVLRGLTANLARALEAHERLTPALRAALSQPPWKRSAADTAALDEVLGRGGRRVFLERDIRTTRPEGVRASFRLALRGLRALRDGEGASLHALTVRMARAFSTAGTRP